MGGYSPSLKCTAGLHKDFTVLNNYILQIDAVIIEGYVTFHKDYTVQILYKIYTEYLMILQNIHRSLVTFNTRPETMSYFYLTIFF